MSFSKALLLPLLLPVALAAVANVEKRQTTCSDVHLFLARGNGEAYPGRVGALSNSVCAGINSCSSENIEFDSSQAYCAQASEGVKNGISQITSYATACPNSKLVLGGYSLGAQIASDILGGASGNFYGCAETTTSGLQRGSFPGGNLAVVLLFGNPRHVANMAYDIGQGSGSDGQFPRTGNSLATMNQYSDIMQDYCLVEDPICVAGGNDGLSHETYMDVYADTAGSFAQMVMGYQAGTPTSSIAASLVQGPTTTADPAASSTSSSTAVASVGAISTQSSSGNASETSTDFSGSSGTSSGTATGTATASSDVSTTESSSSPSSSSSSSSSEESSSSSDSSSAIDTATFSPFVFANTATVATTSTYVPTSYSSTIEYTATTTKSKWTPPATTAAAALSTQTTGSGSAKSSSKSTSLATVASDGGASGNGVELTLSLVSLIVIKVLAF